MKIDIVVPGNQKPQGEVFVSGAKNSATRLLAAASLAQEPVRLRNFPTHLVDAKYKIDFFRQMGSEVLIDHGESSIEINNPDSFLEPATYDVPIRTTYLLAAGQLIRNGIAKIPYPGGCKIGARGYDLHIMVWEQLGCSVAQLEDHMVVRGTLKGAHIDFPISTVGGTENALICASVAKGVTEIKNAYITPEVYDLISLLRQMGVHIDCYGNSLIKVHGVNGLLRGASFSVMPDRIEALTWIIFAAISKGDVLVHGVPFEHMQVPLLHLEEAGIDIFRNSNSVYINDRCVSIDGIQPFELACGTHPGVISDMQSFYTLLGMRANGKSRIYDYRYPERIAYAGELSKLCEGDAIQREHGKITTNGIAKLRGARVCSTDLRGSMALILAAFIAEGESYIADAHMALRGYNNLQKKLNLLGLNIEVVDKAHS
jgi:UDP-N-acetylglucosamine 1-carboxyvinyltransferase